MHCIDYLIPKEDKDGSCEQTPGSRRFSQFGAELGWLLISPNLSIVTTSVSYYTRGDGELVTAAVAVVS